MHWTAKSDLAWVHLSATSGDVLEGDDPAVLTMSADPGGLAAGSELSARVTITAVSHSIVIPVSLSVGDIHLTSNISPSFKAFYLPLLRK
jgi:hypothetical protein